MSDKSLLYKKNLQSSSHNIVKDDELPPFRNEEAFEKMQNVLTEDQVNILKKMKNNLRVHYETGQVFRSEVEMRFSVLSDGKFPNADAKYWQAVREQNVHFTNLVILGYEYDQEQIHLKQLKDQIKKHQIKQRKIQRDLESKENIDTLDLEEMQLQIEMIQNKIDTLHVEIEKLTFFQADRKRVAFNRWREVVTWEKLMIELRPKMKYGVLSYEHHQPESYGRRMETQYQTMLKSGAKGSPSEAINITNQNNMIKKLTKEGILKPERVLPIDKAAQKVVETINSGKNYIDKSDNWLINQKEQKRQYVNDKIVTQLKQPVNKERIKEEEKEEPIFNPQVPQE